MGHVPLPNAKAVIFSGEKTPYATLGLMRIVISSHIDYTFDPIICLWDTSKNDCR